MKFKSLKTKNETPTPLLEKVAKTPFVYRHLKYSLSQTHVFITINKNLTSFDQSDYLR